MWRNWQTRKFQVLVGQPVKSSSLFICTKGLAKANLFLKDFARVVRATTNKFCVPPIKFCKMANQTKCLFKKLC